MLLIIYSCIALELYRGLFKDLLSTSQKFEVFMYFEYLHSGKKAFIQGSRRGRSSIVRKRTVHFTVSGPGDGLPPASVSHRDGLLSCYNSNSSWILDLNVFIFLAFRVIGLSWFHNLLALHSMVLALITFLCMTPSLFVLLFSYPLLPSIWVGRGVHNFCSILC